MCRGIVAEIVPDPEKFRLDEELMGGKILLVKGADGL